MNHGADPNHSDHCGRNAIKVAAKSGHDTVVRLLEEHSANQRSLRPGINGGQLLLLFSVRLIKFKKEYFIKKRDTKYYFYHFSLAGNNKIQIVNFENILRIFIKFCLVI